LAETFLAHRGEDTGAGSSADRYQVVVHVDQSILPDTPRADGSEPHGCELDEGPALALDTVRRLACDATIVGVLEDADGEPLNVGRKTRSIPPALSRALRARDRGCRFPGCERTRFTQGHHVKHWADGGETKLSNLVTLCSFHHHLVHEGGFGLTATDDGLFVFTRPDGRRIPEGGDCFRGNISPPRRTESVDCSFEETLRVLHVEPRRGLEHRCEHEPLPLARRVDGLQPGDRGHDVPARSGAVDGGGRGRRAELTVGEPLTIQTARPRSARAGSRA
jgi:hypothetical protein